jgi:hypothetical protein
MENAETAVEKAEIAMEKAGIAMEKAENKRLLFNVFYPVGHFHFF